MDHFVAAVDECVVVYGVHAWAMSTEVFLFFSGCIHCWGTFFQCNCNRVCDSENETTTPSATNCMTWSSNLVKLFSYLLHSLINIYIQTIIRLCFLPFTS